MAPGKSDPEERELVDFPVGVFFENIPVSSDTDCFPFSVATPIWIELYFDTVPSAAVDLFSVMELFRVDTSNNSLSFSPRSIRDDDFSFPVPWAGWEDYKRVEIRGFLTNTVNPGVVTFQIGEGLCDTLGNRNEKAFRIPLLK
jgi:hypothetical protein